MLLQIGMMMRSGITSCHQILKRPSIALGLTEINWPMVMNLQLWMRQGPSFVHRNLLSFEYLNEEYNLLYFKEIFHFFIYNEQLHFNKSFHQYPNETIFVDIPTKYARNILPSLAIEQWPEHEFSGLSIFPSSYIYVRPSNGITKQACPIELYSYPFDKHTCEVSFIFGKFYLHK